MCIFVAWVGCVLFCGIGIQDWLALMCVVYSSVF